MDHTENLIAQILGLELTFWLLLFFMCDKNSSGRYIFTTFLPIEQFKNCVKTRYLYI